MADTKQYIKQEQEKGSVQISLDVIAAIICRAVTEVEGVVGFSGKPTGDISDLLSKKNAAKGIRVEVGQNDELFIDCNLILSYGQSVVSVAANAQQAITDALENMTGIDVKSVNINVCGITQK